MDNRLIGAAGLGTTTLFLGGFATLFIYNPQTIEELDIMSLSAYNILGVKGQAWVAYLIYFLVGILNAAFIIGLIKRNRKEKVVLLGMVLLLACGLLWASFGVVPVDVKVDNTFHLMLIRTILILILGPVGLIILGAEFEKISKDKFLKYFTLSSGFFILFMGFLSTFFFNDETYIRTNISLAVYFMWFGVLGFRMIKRASTQQNKISNAGRVL